MQRSIVGQLPQQFVFRSLLLPDCGTAVRSVQSYESFSVAQEPKGFDHR
jgi:hypothetical protein